MTIGSEAGDMYLIDKRKSNDFISVSNCFNSAVHKVLYNSNENVAVCGDNKFVLIYDCNEGGLKKCYESVEHSGIVRGMCWYGDKLYSCGFDKKIVTHIL